MEIQKKALLSTAVFLSTFAISNLATAATTTIVSYTPWQIISNNNSAKPSLSKGSTAIAFESDATNLVPYSTSTPWGDGNSARDIFLRVGGRTFVRLSVNSLGQEAENSAFSWYNQPGGGSAQNARSSNVSLSADGKFAVFQSNANNLDLLTTDSNPVGGATDIFLRDVAKKKTYRISGIMDAADGSITAGLMDIFSQPLSSTDAPWKIVTEADDISYNPVIAGTAKNATAAFVSDATNLITGFSLVNGNSNVFAINLQTKKPELVNAVHDTITGAPTTEGDGGSFGDHPALSPDGRFVVFSSYDQNIVSGVAYPSNSSNIFIYDRLKFQMYQLSGATVAAGNGYVVNTEGNNDSMNPSITGGGKGKNYLIAFESSATNIDALGGSDSAGTSDVFVVEFGPVNPKDTNSAYEIKPSATTGEAIRRISAQIDPTTGIATTIGSRRDGTSTAQSTVPVIAGTSAAYTVAFKSTADNLIADSANQYWNIDTNTSTDIYVFNSKTKLFSRANVDSNGQQDTVSANDPTIAPDGKGIAFDTTSQSLVSASYLGNGSTQVYLRK